MATPDTNNSITYSRVYSRGRALARAIQQDRHVAAILRALARVADPPPLPLRGGEALRHGHDQSCHPPYWVAEWAAAHGCAIEWWGDAGEDFGWIDAFYALPRIEQEALELRALARAAREGDAQFVMAVLEAMTQFQFG